MKVVEEEEVVWFSNPSREAARARREKAKDIMGRELWKTIMEDSSDDDDDEPDEEFYFYGGGWHSSPQPIKDLLVEENQSAEESPAIVFDEGSGKNMVGAMESNNQSLLNTSEHSDARVREDQTKVVVNKDDPHNKNHSNIEFGSAVENIQESDLIVDEVEIRHNDDDAYEITQNVDTIVDVLLEHHDPKEQTNEDDDNQHGHNDDADLDLRLTETQTANVMLKDETNNESDCPMDPSSQVMVVSIESVCDESNGHLGGFKHNIRCWIRFVHRVFKKTNTIERKTILKAR